jgi:hypothetical protein
MRNKTLTALIAIGFVSIVSSRAQAQTTAGALQLGLGTNLLTYSSDTISEHQVLNNGTTIEYKGIEQNTTWGLANRNGIYLDAGYGITDMLVLGGMLQLGSWSNTTGDRDLGNNNGTAQANEHRFTLFLGPKLDVMFLPDTVVRPFVGVGLGLVRHTYTTETTTHNGAGATITATPNDLGVTGVGLLARAGIRWFLTPGFSLDPAFVFGFSSATGTMVIPPNGQTNGHFDTGVTGYTVGLQMAFSGWIGL